jgi:acylphosphatase
MTVERRVIRISGHVQGVNYRRETRRQAERLGLRGFARNEPDGSVTVDVEGAPNALNELVVWCRRGPDGAIVERVEVETLPLVGYQGFSVR